MTPVELAAFTPAGQTREAYVDLLAYSVVPRVAGSNDTEEEMRAFERKREGCRSIMVRDHEGAAGWYDSEYLCIGREGAAPDALEIEMSSVRLGKQGVFRVWRSWRGSPAELTAMLKSRFNLELEPVHEGENLPREEIGPLPVPREVPEERERVLLALDEVRVRRVDRRERLGLEDRVQADELRLPCVAFDRGLEGRP